MGREYFACAGALLLGASATILPSQNLLYFHIVYHYLTFLFCSSVAVKLYVKHVSPFSGLTLLWMSGSGLKAAFSCSFPGDKPPFCVAGCLHIFLVMGSPLHARLTLHPSVHLVRE